MYDMICCHVTWYWCVVHTVMSLNVPCSSRSISPPYCSSLSQLLPKYYLLHLLHTFTCMYTPLLHLCQHVHFDIQFTTKPGQIMVVFVPPKRVFNFGCHLLQAIHQKCTEPHHSNPVPTNGVVAHDCHGCTKHKSQKQH